MKSYIVRFPKTAEPRDPRPASTQFLGFVEHSQCRECGQKIKWRIRKTYRMADAASQRRKTRNERK